MKNKSNNYKNHELFLFLKFSTIKSFILFSLRVKLKSKYYLKLNFVDICMIVNTILYNQNKALVYFSIYVFLN